MEQDTKDGQRHRGGRDADYGADGCPSGFADAV
jgi:hypothetical protein